MNELYFIEQTNFDVPEIIYNILMSDSDHFGYIKNDKPNLSGFLNVLIPNLAMYREKLHYDFLKNNNNDEKMAKIIEQNIYNTYLKTFDMTDDSTINIQLRINKENKNDFIKIQDEYLAKYNMTFSKYMKSLLSEYASRPLFQREVFYLFKFKETIIDAMKKNKYLYFYLIDNTKIKIVPVDIAVNQDTLENYIFGFLNNKEKVYAIKYSGITNVLQTNEKLDLSNEDYDDILELENELFNNLQKYEDEENEENGK